MTVLTSDHSASERMYKEASNNALEKIVTENKKQYYFSGQYFVELFLVLSFMDFYIKNNELIMTSPLTY